MPWLLVEEGSGEEEIDPKVGKVTAAAGRFSRPLTSASLFGPNIGAPSGAQHCDLAPVSRKLAGAFVLAALGSGGAGCDARAERGFYPAIGSVT